MILAPAVPDAPLMALVSLKPRSFALGSAGQRAQWAQPPQAAGLEPGPAQLDPGVARHPLKMHERVGSVDVGDAQSSDVDRDGASPVREEQLCRLEQSVACPAAKGPGALERRRSDGQLQHWRDSVDITDISHDHYLRHRGAGGRDSQGGSGATPAFFD